MSKIFHFLKITTSSLLILASLSFAQLNEFGYGNYFSGSKDFIEVSYGFGNFKHKNIDSDFKAISQNEIILGRRFIKPIFGFKLIYFTDNYLFSSYSNNLSNESSVSKNILSETWRFGLGYRKGYGYKLGNMAIMPYNHMGFSWSKNNFSLLSSSQFNSNPFDIRNLDFYDEEIKFGTSNTGGFDIQISRIFGIGASYETVVIFPYHKFWKQFGSFFIETISQTGIDFLTEGVLIKAIPSFTPILYFLMKNGLSYYLFTLKQEKMNWPFTTVAPLTLEVIKVDLKITF
jgi:hypothetical protein